MSVLAVLAGLVKVAVIFGLLLLTLRMVGRLNGRSAPSSGRGGDVRVVSRSSIGRSASLVVVRMGARQYVLGVTEQAVNLLTEVAADDGPPEPPPARTPADGDRPSWKDLLETIRERTVRR